MTRRDGAEPRRHTTETLPQYLREPARDLTKLAVNVI